MNFIINRKINDGILKTEIAFDSYGSNTFTEDEEKKLIQKIGCPIIDVGGEPHTGKVKHDKEENRIKIDKEGEEIFLILNSRKMPVNEDFRTDFVIDSNKISENDLTEVLNTPLKIAEAKCVLFEHNITKRIEDALEKIKDKTTNFDKESPLKITI